MSFRFSLTSWLHNRCVRWPLALLVTSLVIAVLIQGFSWLMRPSLPVADPAAQVVIASAPLPAYDLSKNPRVHVDVDYSQGPQAAWWPKGESPVLAAMVADRELPPVAERVGPEPLVIRPIDGPGVYGGTQTIFNLKPDHSLANLGRATLLRWSPMGEPLVPGLARTWSVSADATVLSFTLRRGLRWSDGQPMTTADIRYAWEQELLNEAVGKVPEILRVRGQPVRLEFEPDGLTFRIVLPFPDSTFLYGLLGNAGGQILLNSPAHYLGRYHPQTGDQTLIAGELKARSLSQPRDLYLRLKRPNNPEHRVPQRTEGRPEGVMLGVATIRCPGRRRLFEGREGCSRFGRVSLIFGGFG